MKPIVLILLLLLCLKIGDANAEGGCPPGQYPQQGQGWQTCVPIPGGNPGETTQAPPPIIWQDRWQAIATDTPKGILGTSLGSRTGEGAEASAIADCRAKGGTSCFVEISYVNGCVAMVVGHERKNVRGAPSKSEAEKAAMAQCESNDKGCAVYYSACSLPERIQ
jgi:hypothetical protein